MNLRAIIKITKFVNQLFRLKANIKNKFYKKFLTQVNDESLKKINNIFDNNYIKVTNDTFIFITHATTDKTYDITEKIKFLFTKKILDSIHINNICEYPGIYINEIFDILQINNLDICYEINKIKTTHYIQKIGEQYFYASAENPKLKKIIYDFYQFVF